MQNPQPVQVQNVPQQAPAQPSVNTQTLMQQAVQTMSQNPAPAQQTSAPAGFQFEDENVDNL